ncbi:MAG: T9SS type A sorting domain-containing protein [Bacteroidales bacterium]|nr:T9SS type A sorting domain-containing protein [Bacteroidales bacterium]
MFLNNFTIFVLTNQSPTNMIKIRHLFLLSLLFAIFIHTSFAQADFPEEGPVFRDDMVPRVDITINPDTLAWIYENVDSNIEFRAQFVFTTDTIQDTIDEIGFRLRGNTSRNSQKKSFKVSFNTYHSGRKYFGLEKLNLNGEHNDPSIIRSKIAWDLMRSFGIPAPRSNHAELYINGNYYGLYIQVEHIDEEFVDSRFENQDGNLYKCLWPADLDYRGSDPDDYKHMQGDRRVYDLKTNTSTDDYSDLAHYISILNNVPTEVFACEISKVFNVYDYLRVIAMDVVLGNWDGPIYNKNNFYLYYNTKSGLIEYIPYDLDNTLGIDWLGRDWGTRDIYDWNKHGEPRPIYTKMIQNDELKEIYSQYMTELLEEEMTGANLVDRILEIKDMITPYVGSDPYYPLDYGYSLQDFHDSYQMALGGHVDYGLIPYLETRRNTALQQLESFQEQSIINHIRHKVKENGSDLRIRAYVREAADTVSIIYRENEGELIELIMYDDGQHFDIEAGDGVYANTIAGIMINTSIQYQIRSINVAQNQRISPCEPIEYFFQESLLPMLVINEFMADNDSIIADEYGEFNDWIEVYNADTDDVYLGDKYLSDNISNSDKWMMPDVVLGAGDFALFWADDNPEKGPWHTNFKLSKDGEEIGIFDSESTGFFPLDTLHYESQLQDVSQGRYPDGGEQWQLFVHPTPGFSNVVDGVENGLLSSEFQIYPNPNSIGVLYFNKTSDIMIYSINGILLLEEKEVSMINLQNLSSGVYFLKDHEGSVEKLIIQ